MDISSTDTSSLDEIVSFVEQRRMHHLSIFMLEMVRPFAGSLAILAEGFAPLLRLCFGPRLSQQIEHLFSDRQRLSLLIERLELSEEQGSCRGR